MRLLALVPSPDHVCARYRLAAFIPFLRREGHVLEWLPWTRFWFFSAPFLRRLGRADVVIVQRRLLPGWQLRILRRLARRLVFDVDDAVFHRDSYAAKGLYCPRRQEEFRRMVGAADAVMAGNSFLAGRARALTAAERVHLVPTCVPVRRYALAQHVTQAEVRLVWIGSSSTLQGLERCAGMLEELGRSMPGLRLRVICDRTLNLRTLPVEFRPWSADREAADLAQCDIGISWLPDDDWSRGKCGLKVLQYMAAGLPVIANPVGVQADLVRPGITGFLANTAQEWRGAAVRLADDPELRRRLGYASRQRVDEGFDVHRGADAWLKLLNRWRTLKAVSMAEPRPASSKNWSPVASAGKS